MFSNGEARLRHFLYQGGRPGSTNFRLFSAIAKSSQIATGPEIMEATLKIETTTMSAYRNPSMPKSVLK